MKGMHYSGLELAKKQAETVVKDFEYYIVMPDVFERIKEAITEDKIADILTTCRKRSK